MRFTKYGLSFGFTGSGLLVLVLLLVAEPRPIASQRAISSERDFPVEAGTNLPILAVHRTGPELSTLDSNISAPQPAGRTLAAAALNGGSSDIRGERALTALKQQGGYESLEKAFIASRYAFRAEEQDSGCSGYRGSNHAHDFLASFSSAGLKLTPGSRTNSDWEVALRLTGYGYGDQLYDATECEVTADGNRIEYRRGAVAEWYVSDPRGLEQGFTIQSPPAAFAQVEHGRLTLLMGVEGNLRPGMSEDGKSLIFHASDGRCLLRYGGLHACDARERELPARLALRGRQVAIEVDDRGAVYPVVVDPVFTSEKKLTASDAGNGDFFGFPVAINGDTVVVGASGNDDAGELSGSAYIFERDAGGSSNWGEVKKLSASDAAGDALFGHSVAISGDRIVVGASGSDSAYIFERDAGGSGNWGEVKKLSVSDAADDIHFGHSVAISGDRVVVAAFDFGVFSPAGSAYIFERDAGGQGNWGEVKKLTPSNAAAFEFGPSVAISGDSVVLGGAPSPDHGDGGLAYIFDRDAGGSGNWGEVKKLSASDDGFGQSVGISGDRVIVTAFQFEFLTPPGSAYIFERDAGGPGNWGEVKKLTPSDAAAFQFGLSVAISGDSVIVGASLPIDTGSAYIFERDAGGSGNWGEAGKLTARFEDHFGSSVAISGDTLVVGAYDDDRAGLFTGTAYVYRRHEGEPPPPCSKDITVDIYEGFTPSGGGAPYSGLAGSFTASDVSFATDTGYAWHPFGLGEFGADIKGFISVCADREYQFCLNSDDGSLLFIDGNLVVNNGDSHPPGVGCGSTILTAGAHRFEVQFFECCGGPSGVDLILPVGVAYGCECPCALICQGDVRECNDPGECGSIVNYPEPTTSGACTGVTISCWPPSGSFFNVGLTHVVCSATNAGVLVATCTFDVEIFDCEHACPPADTDPPLCELIEILRGPPAQLHVRVQDTGSGLKEIKVVEAINAIVNLPSIMTGTTESQIVVATKIDQSKQSVVELELVDVAGNVTRCDPVITSLELNTGKSLTQTFTGIPKAESFVTVQNGIVGLQKLQVKVNGQQTWMIRLRDNLSTTIDISSVMEEGDNTITLIGQGNPGASALVIIADSGVGQQHHDHLLNTDRRHGQLHRLVWGKLVGEAESSPQR